MTNYRSNVWAIGKSEVIHTSCEGRRKQCIFVIGYPTGTISTKASTEAVPKSLILLLHRLWLSLLLGGSLGASTHTVGYSHGELRLLICFILYNFAHVVRMSGVQVRAQVAAHIGWITIRVCNADGADASSTIMVCTHML